MQYCYACPFFSPINISVFTNIYFLVWISWIITKSSSNSSVIPERRVVLYCSRHPTSVKWPREGCSFIAGSCSDVGASAPDPPYWGWFHVIMRARLIIPVAVDDRPSFTKKQSIWHFEHDRISMEVLMYTRHANGDGDIAWSRHVLEPASWIVFKTIRWIKS